MLELAHGRPRPRANALLPPVDQDGCRDGRGREGRKGRKGGREGEVGTGRYREGQAHPEGSQGRKGPLKEGTPRESGQGGRSQDRDTLVYRKGRREGRDTSLIRTKREVPIVYVHVRTCHTSEISIRITSLMRTVSEVPIVYSCVQINL